MKIYLNFNSNFFNILLVGGTLVLNKNNKNWTKKYFESDETNKRFLYFL